MIKYSKLIATVALVALASFVLAACGGMSKSEYTKEMKKVSAKAEKSFKKLESGEPNEAAMKDAAKKLRTVAKEVDEITPPSDVKDAHEDLVKVLNDAADVFDDFAPMMAEAEKVMKDPASADPAKMESMQKDMEKLQKDFEEIDERMTKVDKAFAKAGYKNLGFKDDK